MARIGFRKLNKVSVAGREDAIFNKQGGIGHRIDNPTQKLIATVGSYLGEAGFFPDKPIKPSASKDYNDFCLDDRGRDILAAALAVARGDRPEDLLVIAHWARQELNMRLSPQLLFVAAARVIRVENQPSPLIRYLPKIASRPDDLLQVLALYNNLYGRSQNQSPYLRAKLPSCLKRAMAGTLASYSDYQLLKYGNSRHHPNWSDVLGVLRGGRLLRKSQFKKDGHYPLSKGMRDYLVDGTVTMNSPASVKARYDFFRLPKDHPINKEVEVLMKVGKLTWENVVSHFGETEDKERLKLVWDFAFEQMPYMARLRNLRNGLEANVSNLVKIGKSLATSEAVAKSKQLPFRFFAASKAIRAMKVKARKADQLELDKAMNEALEVSVDNLPTLAGRTAVFVDCSGSMSWKPISKNSILYPSDVACLLGALVQRVSNDAVVMAFATTVQRVSFKRGASIIGLAERIARVGAKAGGGTNIAACLDYLRDKKLKVDRIIMFSDMQPGCGGAVGDALRRYRSSWSQDCFYHSVDLQSHGQSSVPASAKRVHLLSGFSERIVHLLKTFEDNLDSADAKSVEKNLLPTLTDLRGRFLIKA
jgi:60 kDa SS-A/Ro ribonucleoprotein